MVLAVVCIPQVVKADTPSTVERQGALDIIEQGIEQGKILNKETLGVLNYYTQYLTVLLKGEIYSCKLKVDEEAVSAQCIKLPIVKWKESIFDEGPEPD